MVTRHDRSQDKLEIVLEGGRVKISIYIGLAEKTFFVGQSLNDDMYHTLIFERRALKIRSYVDDDAPVIGNNENAIDLNTVWCKDVIYLKM